MSNKKLDAVLNKKLFSWPDHPHDHFLVRDSIEGVQIMGSSGSGKSSSSGRLLARKMIANGYGGIVLCAKPDERKVFEQYISAEGREGDMVIFREGQGQFNPIFYEQHRTGSGANQTINIANLITSINTLIRNFNGEGGGDKSEKFWDNAIRRCIHRHIDLLKLSDEDVTIMNMRKIIVSTFNPQSMEKLNTLNKELQEGKDDVKEVARQKMKEWQTQNYCLKCLVNMTNREGFSEDELETMGLVESYFLTEIAYLSEKTKTIIIEGFLGLISEFETGILRKQFSGGISEDLWPENTYKRGSIILLDFPIKEWGLSGVIAQGMMKLLFQQAMERRNIERELNPRPVFLYVDENQLFSLPVQDAQFQSTARSSLTATVYLTQSLNSYYSAMGSSNSEALTKALLANLATKIFHASNDMDTNKMASELVGNEFREMTTMSSRNNKFGEAQLSQSLHPKIFPHEFTMLKKGGERSNGFKAEAIVFKSPNRGWHNKESYLRCEFPQR